MTERIADRAAAPTLVPVATLAELARLHTRLRPDQVDHLQRLVATWGLLADFCFADLLLWVRESDTARYVVLGQIRPTTSQTVYRGDWVGTVVDEAERPLVARTFHRGEIIEGEVESERLKERVRVLAIPIRFEGDVLGVLTREAAPAFGRRPGELERVYTEVFSRFARMIAAGEFPFAIEQSSTEELPRVGDGVMLLDANARVEYTSPNAVSALHRVGVHANMAGTRLAELGVDDTAIRAAFSLPMPVTLELERGPEVTVVLRCIPLLEQGVACGAVMLTRDISELRRRDRLLLSKDATIQEIHHRVKNNLQTISSLLRLQGRRLSSREAKAAIDESVRRVRSIAVVHETLSREASGDVPFADIVRPIARMVEEALYSPERQVRCVVEGDAGNLSPVVATPLAVVLNELLQNAYDHAYPEGVREGLVLVRISSGDDGMEMDVIDDGVGLPASFSLEHATGLGLSIVRTLVRSELGGEIEMVPRGADGELEAHHRRERPGTAVSLRIPLDQKPL